MPVLRPNARLGPYTVVEMIRMGGMACIYLAQWAPAENAPPSYAVVKVANTSADVVRDHDQPAGDLEAFYYEALSNEVEVLKKLHHPNIVRLYPVPWGIKKDPYIARATNVGGAPWFCAMEYLAGGTVTQLVEQYGVLEPRMALEIAYQVTLALDHMHSKGYAHLDVKPDNIMLRQPLSVEGNRDPQAVLIDFGISRRHRQAGPEAGSLPYTPPELVPLMSGAVAPEMAVDGPPVDVYAVGVLLYHMVTGHLPFTGHNSVSITTAILKNEPTRPSIHNPRVAGPLEDLIMETLQKEPARRPTADKLILLLDEVLAPQRALTTRPLPVRPLPPRAGQSKSRVRLFAGTTLLLAALSVAQFVFWGPLRPPASIAAPPPATPLSATTAAPNTPAASSVETSTPVMPAPAADTETPTETLPPSPTAAPTRTPAPTETPRPVFATSTPVNTRTPTTTPRPTLPPQPTRTPAPAASATP